MSPKPPPLPRKRSSRPPPSRAFSDSEAPTTPKGIEYRVAMLAKFFAACDEADQAYLLRLAETYAARNAKT